MKSKHFKFGNWQRTTSKHGRRYFHNGKFTTRVAFNRANARRKSKITTFFVEEVSEKSRKIVKVSKIGKPIALCRVKDRELLYEQIKKDRRALFQKLSDEEFSALRIVVDIGRKRKTKMGGISQQGNRTFIDLRKFRNFLGLNYKYDSGGLHEPVNWTRRGVCKYQKRVALTVRRLRGERVIGEKVIKQYAIQQP